MAKKDKNKEVEVEGQLGEILDDAPETKKKLIKHAADIVRRLDNVVSELYELREDSQSLIDGTLAPTTDFAPKDMQRFEEMFTVIDASVGILYQLAKRMSRKYVGKEIADLDHKRKSLKV